MIIVTMLWNEKELRYERTEQPETVTEITTRAKSALPLREVRQFYGLEIRDVMMYPALGEILVYIGPRTLVRT